MQLHEQRQPAAARPALAPHLGLPYVEFIALIAMMMALTAFSIDLMLPALPMIGAAMGVSDPNDRQIIIISYVLGFSVGQLAYGRLSDRFGRKPILMLGLGIFIIGSLAAVLAGSFPVLLAARTVQGLGAAAPRVIALAIVRDLYSGRQMARVMSFAMTVFIIIPVLAPSVGQGLLEAGSWRWTLDALLVGGLVMTAWIGLRLPETRHPEDASHPLSLGASLKLALETPQTAGYAVGSGFLFGCLMSYVSSSQQVFVDVFHIGAGFPIAFGAIASLLAVAAVTNAYLVERLGMRRVSHTALTGFIIVSAAMTIAAVTGLATLWVFMAMMSLLFFLFGLVAPNFNALAMEPQGHNAGMASSFVGFTSTGAGAVFGGIVGHFFDGSVLPLSIGFTCLSLATFATVIWVEGIKGLYRPTH